MHFVLHCRFFMWCELRTWALANHNNYVIHMQTLCHSVIRDHISLTGFFRGGVIIFSYAEGKPRQFIWDLGSWRRCSVGGDTCGRHAASAGVRGSQEGCCRLDGRREGHEGASPLLFTGLPQSATPALPASTLPDPWLAASQLWRYHRRWRICVCIHTVSAP